MKKFYKGQENTKQSHVIWKEDLEWEEGKIYKGLQRDLER